MARLEQLLDLLEQNPKDSFVRFALAKEYENAGEVEKALEYYSTLLQNNPDYVGAYFHLAQLHADRHQNEEAFRVYDLGIAVAKKLGDQHALSELSSARMNLEMEDLL
ncbi:MAG: tetratricopeptide repeat protein [Saprospiraceae bacterium]|nr:tetratricopeptide repeat protein [Saprospiraceae bacterium]MCB9323028.1 tetratricopeptide repeat protein [Lewinellaceae bacterium]